MVLLVEVYLPSGVLSAQQRERLAHRLVAFMEEDEHSPAVLEDSRALTQVLLLEPQTWVAGDRIVGDHGNVRYVARVSVPAPWVKPVREEVVRRFTRIIREVVRETAAADPQVWVEIRGVRDGSWGMDGRTLSTTEIERMVTQRRRAEVRGQGSVPGPRPGTVHDPICDMVVELNDAAITLMYGDETYGYCTKGCRMLHAKELGVEA